jgi:hypothetical protein
VEVYSHKIEASSQKPTNIRRCQLRITYHSEAQNKNQREQAFLEKHAQEMKILTEFKMEVKRVHSQKSPEISVH